MSTIHTGLDLDILSRPVRLDLNLNDLRIIVGCFRAVAYQAKMDNEPYLDPDATDLSQRLEQQYRTQLEEPDGRNTE